MQMDWAWSDINYWAVIVSTIATMVIGYVWFSPVLFANVWMKLTGLKQENMKGAIIGALILSFVINLLVAVLLQMTHTKDLSHAIGLGVIIALIVIISLGVNFLFERKGLKLYFITAGYYVVTIIVTSIILGLWLKSGVM